MYLAYNWRYTKVFHGSSVSQEFASQTGDPSSVPGSERSPREGNGNPLQNSCLENPMKEEPGGLQSMGVTKESNTI